MPILISTYPPQSRISGSETGARHSNLLIQDPSDPSFRTESGSQRSLQSIGANQDADLINHLAPEGVSVPKDCELSLFSAFPK